MADLAVSDLREVSANPLGHQFNESRRWHGHSVCEWCNAVEGTSDGAKKCPMAYTVADRPNDWVRKSKFGGHSKGYGPFGSGSRHFEYPDPEKLEIKEREYNYYQYNLKEIKMAEQRDEIMQFFDTEHLSDDLKGVSLPFCHLAETIVEVLPRCAERTVALRKLLEAKDAAVRAKMVKPKETAPRLGFSEQEIEQIRSGR